MLTARALPATPGAGVLPELWSNVIMPEMSARRIVPIRTPKRSVLD
jgi:hypothetical protein